MTPLLTLIANILIISAIMVWIIDLTTIIDELEVGIAKWLTVKKVRIPKPFSCSLCMTWWADLIYLIVTNSFTLYNIGLVALVAFLTPVTYQALQLIRGAGEKFFVWIMEKLHI